MTKKILLQIFTIIMITVLGGTFRFYKIQDNPPSLTGDEISFGYSAYSILKTGRDEYGKFMPLVFESIGDYKNPIPVYLIALSIKFFGLNEFAVRFPNALLGTLSIPLFYFFILDVFKKKNIATIGGLIVSVSAWHIFYSRFSYETLMASLFVLLGIWGFLKMKNGSFYWALFSAFFFTLTMYTAFAPRLFIPAFIIVATLFDFDNIKANWKTLVIFGMTCLILGIPLLYSTIFQGAGTRMQAVFIGNDLEFSRNIIHKYFNSVYDLPLLFFFWAKRYISYLNPSLLFFNSLDATMINPIGLGIMYVFEIPTFVMGTIYFIKNRIPYKYIFVIWILTGLLPDSLTNNQQHIGRLLHLFPAISLISALGAIELVNMYHKIKQTYIKLAIFAATASIIIIILIHSYLVIAINFPRDKGESFEEGWNEAVMYVNANKDKYNEIVFDPARGIDGPNMISNPFLYVLFYTKYDPFTYQSEIKNRGENTTGYYYGFDKYVFRHIDWPIDSFKKGVLFIGSPWSIKKEKLKEGELLKTIILSNGSEAFYIVTPK